MADYQNRGRERVVVNINELVTSKMVIDQPAGALFPEDDEDNQPTLNGEPVNVSLLVYADIYNDEADPSFPPYGYRGKYITPDAAEAVIDGIVD